MFVSVEVLLPCQQYFSHAETSPRVREKEKKNGINEIHVTGPSPPELASSDAITVLPKANNGRAYALKVGAPPNHPPEILQAKSEGPDQTVDAATYLWKEVTEELVDCLVVQGHPFIK